MAAAPIPAELSGHLGHLDDKQQKIYDELHASELAAHEETLDFLAGLDRARILKKEQREATDAELFELRAEREREWPYELLRFARAKKWVLKDIQSGYRSFLSWRRAQKVDSILDRLPYNVEMIRRVASSSSTGTDRAGRPIYIEKSGAVHIDAILSLFTDDDILQCHIWEQENSVQRARESSVKLGKHIELFTQILDLKELSSASQRALKFTKALFEIDASQYPERLGDLFVINAPWVFSIIWGIVKGWIDPVTRSKIHIIKGDPSARLLENISPDNLPQEYGGSAPNIREFTLHELLAVLPLKEADQGPDGFDLQLTDIKHGKRYDVSLECEAAGEVVEWYWKQEEKQDIDWSAWFTPKVGVNGEAPKARHFITECRVIGVGLLPAQGSFQVPEAGTVTLQWSNHFSWLAHKKIEYMIRKTERRREAVDVQLAPEEGAEAAAAVAAVAISGEAAAAPAAVAAAEAEEKRPPSPSAASAVAQ